MSRTRPNKNLDSQSVTVPGQQIDHKLMLEQLHEDLFVWPIKRLPSLRNVLQRAFTMARAQDSPITSAICDQVINEVLDFWEEVGYSAAFRGPHTLSASLRTHCNKVTALYDKRDPGFSDKETKYLTKLAGELDRVFDVLNQSKLSHLELHDVKFYRAQLNGQGYIEWPKNVVPDFVIR